MHSLLQFIMKYPNFAPGDDLEYTLRQVAMTHVVCYIVHMPNHLIGKHCPVDWRASVGSSFLDMFTGQAFSPLSFAVFS